MTNLNLSLKAFSRQLVGKKVEQLRGQGKIPAVLYGHSIKPINLAVDYVAFEKLFRQTIQRGERQKRESFMGCSI